MDKRRVRSRATATVAPHPARLEGGRYRQAGSRKATLLALALVTIATCACYAQVGKHDFIGLDDPAYVIENDQVVRGLTLEGMRWALTAADGNWHPLTWLSHMADLEMFGSASAGHHLLNLLVHIANSALLLLVLRQMTGLVWPSALVAALFALHPLHVESVAWVAERKDVLSAFFWILTMGLYARYARAPSAGRYLATVAAFALGLMAKPMLVTLPLVLLLLDYWPLGRLRPAAAPRAGATPAASRRSLPPGAWPRLVAEKLSLLLLSALSCAVTLLAQRRGKALIPIESIPLGLRLANALVAYVTYVAKTLWPRSLAIYYPHPGRIPLWQAGGAAFGLVALSALALGAGRKRPYLTVGWLWFVGTLVPVIGLVQVGEQAMADRYTYIPLIGLFWAFAWGGAEAASRGRIVKHALVAVVLLALASLGLRTWVQVGYWKSTRSLFEHALRVTSNNSMAHTVLANDLLSRGEPARAVVHYHKALAIDPGYPRAHNNLAAALVELGELDEAIEHCRIAIRLDPDHAGWHLGLADALHRKGLLDQAIAAYQKGRELDPSDVRALNGLGVARLDRGEIATAIGLFSQALRIRPARAEPHYNLGLALSRRGDSRLAIAHFEKAIALGLSDADTHYQLAQALHQNGQPARALEHYREALRIDPGHEGARRALRALSAPGAQPSSPSRPRT